MLQADDMAIAVAANAIRWGSYAALSCVISKARGYSRAHTLDNIELLLSTPTGNLLFLNGYVLEPYKKKRKTTDDGGIFLTICGWIDGEIKAHYVYDRQQS